MSTKNTSNDFICNFCLNKYSSKSNMLMHQKTAKKCLILRNIPLVEYSYKCEHCNFVSVRKSSLTSHQSSCKKMKKETYEILEKEAVKKDTEINNLTKILEDKEKTIIRLEKELKECKDQLKDNFNMIASRPNIVNTTNTTTKINNLIIADFKESTIRDKVESNFTLEHLNDGLRGVAKFTKDHIVNSDDGNPKYICSDPSRAVFKYKDENGVVQKDVKATRLKNAIKDPIITKSKKLFIDENSRLFDSIANNDDDDDENNERMNEQITVLKDNFLKVKNIDDNQSDYAKEMVLCLLRP